MIVGKRGSGKTTLLDNLIEHLATKNNFYFTHNHTISEKVKANFEVTNDWTELEMLVATQKRIKAENNGNLPEICIVFEDFLYDRRSLHHPLIKELTMSGKHLNVTLIFVVQVIQDWPPFLRHNIDYLFCHRDTSLANTTRLYQQHFSIIPTLNQFTDIYHHCTDNYGVLVLDNTSKAKHDMKNSVLWFKARVDSN